MNKNMKKIAIALVATNVVASSLITTLPPVQTHAAEQKLTSNLKATTSYPQAIALTRPGQALIAGHVAPNVTVLVATYKANNTDVSVAQSVTCDADGNYKVSFATLTEGMRITVATTNGELVGDSKVTSPLVIPEGSTAVIDPIYVGDNIVTGRMKVPTGERAVLRMDPIPYNSSPGFMSGASILTNDYFVMLVPSDMKARMPAGQLMELRGDFLPAMYTNVLGGSRPTGLALDVNDIATTKGSTGKLGVTVSPADASQSVTYKSGDTNILSIDANGNWIAKETGTTTVTVTSTVNSSLSKNH
ncbi:Ig-like domain-containing protein [Listeria cornellensis]|nr:Ig-like domain-containing protein [Listeria cornellensis]